MHAVLNRFGARIDEARIEQTRIARLHEKADAVLNGLDRFLLGEGMGEIGGLMGRMDAEVHEIAAVERSDEAMALHARGVAFIEAGRKQVRLVEEGRRAEALALHQKEVDPAYSLLEGRIETLNRLCERRAQVGIEELAAVSMSGLLLSAALVTYFAARHRQKVSELAGLEGQRASQSTRALLEAQVNSSVDGILIVDPKGKILLQNRRMGEIWGIPDELLNSDDDEKQIAFVLNSVKDPDEFVTTVQSLYANPLQVQNDEIELRNGKIIDRHSGPAVGADGTVYGRIWIFRDLTERVYAERALRENEARLFRLMESMPQLVWSALPDGWNLYFNHQWHEYTGQTTDESGAYGWQACVHPDDRKDTDLLGSTPTVFEVENRIRRADGVYRWFLIRGIPMTDAAGAIVQWFGTCTDIDDLKLSEDLLREAQEELEERIARRTHDLAAATQEAKRANAAKSEFLSRMSHELRTPLNAILGFGQILQRQDMGAAQRESVDYILKGGRHLLGLINEVLDLSRVEAGRTDLSIEPVPVAEVLDESLAMVRHAAADRGIELQENLGLFADVYVRADRQRLKQVLINLLSNAVKYNRPQGRIAVRAHDDGETLRIAVEDTGLGISEEGLAKLFTPFERLNAGLNVEGTGLGLFLAQKLVSAMGGTLTVESEPGKGSTFSVELALAQAPAEAFLETKERPTLTLVAATETETRTRRILSIEDNSANTRLLEAMLADRREIALRAAIDGREGLALARREGPDLILLDLNLPDMHGVDVLKRLRRSAVTSSIPVIVVSADTNPETIAAAIAAGADAFLPKPLDAERFLQALDAHLADPKADDSPAREAA